MSERIKINEIDNTNAALSVSSTDIVYIPGLAVKCTSATADGGVTYTYTCAQCDEKYRDTPILFTTLESFIEAFGNSPFRFMQYTGDEETTKTELTYADMEFGFTRSAALSYKYGTNTFQKLYPASPKETDRVEECVDKSYIFAVQMLNKNIPILFQAFDVVYSNTTINNANIILTNFYADLAGTADEGTVAPIDQLKDKGAFDFKYLTTGGWPVLEYKDNTAAIKLMGIANDRGDCEVLIDHNDINNRPLAQSDADGIYMAYDNVANSVGADKAGFFTPWADYSLTSAVRVGNETIGSFAFPASYAYLSALARSIITNASWLAIAGTTRGVVGDIIRLRLVKPLTNSIADSYQMKDNEGNPQPGTSVNAITFIKNYGYCIWGNRTGRKNPKGLQATSFLNIRNLICEVKKQAFTSAMSNLFEQDSEIIWINFTAPIRKLLDYMVTNQGLSNYKIVRQQSDQKAKLKCVITLYPIYALEAVEIDVILSDEEVTVG